MALDLVLFFKVEKAGLHAAVVMSEYNNEKKIKK